MFEFLKTWVWIPFLCLNEMYTTNQKYIKNTKPTIITTTPVIKKLKFVWNTNLARTWPFLSGRFYYKLCSPVSPRPALSSITVLDDCNVLQASSILFNWTWVYEHFRSPHWKEILIRRLVRWKWYSIWTFEFPINKYHILNAGTAKDFSLKSDRSK